MKNEFENKFKNEFEILLAAGDSKTSSIEAIEKAKAFKFEEAKELLRKSEKEMITAHQIEANLVSEEANNNGKNYGVLMMHAQDHLMAAIIFWEMASQFVALYEELYKLKGGNNDKDLA